MFKFSRLLSLGLFSLAFSFLLADFHQLSAYPLDPRRNTDTTNRMNTGGDPPNRPALKDNQRKPESVTSTSIRNPEYNTGNTPQDASAPHYYYNTTQNSHPPL